MVDLADEIIAQQPDAVLIYSGHNEWYGALGVGSTETLASRPRLVRLTLALQRWRTFMAIRQGIVWIRRKHGDPRAAIETASLMETLAREREIVLGGPSYEQGVRQFAGNSTS